MVCRKRSCYDTRNCFIDSLASRLHILQFVTWPISIFQADIDKNPSAPHTRLHFVMTWRMHGGGGEGNEKDSHLPTPPPRGRKIRGRNHTLPCFPPWLCWPWSLGCFRLSLPVNAHEGVHCHGGGSDQALSTTTVPIHCQGEILGLVWWSRKNEARGDRLTQHFPLDLPTIKDTSETIKCSLNSGGSPHSQPLLTCLQARGAYHLPWQPILFGERSNS